MVDAVVTSVFPSIWDYIIPALNGWTLAGVIAIIVSIILALYVPVLKKFNLGLLLAGIFMIWGTNIIAKFLNSVGGLIIFWGSIITVIFGVVLFWDELFGKKRSKK